MSYLLDTVEWKEVEIKRYADEDDTPWVTHEGILDLGGMKIKVFQLSDGQRVIDESSLTGLLLGPHES